MRRKGPGNEVIVTVGGVPYNLIRGKKTKKPCRDWIVDTNKGVIRHKGTRVCTAGELYSDLMDQFDDLSLIDFPVPMEAIPGFPVGGGVTTMTVYRIVNGWKFDEGSLGFVRDGGVILHAP